MGKSVMALGGAASEPPGFMTCSATSGDILQQRSKVWWDNQMIFYYGQL